MAEPRFMNAGAIDGDDDLPRTLRREKEAQARRAREQELFEGEAAAPSPAEAAAQFQPQHYEYDEYEPAPATVTRLDIPFFHLMLFFLKATVAAIPALILLLAILWGIGEALTATFPELIKMQVLIRMPN